MDTETSAARTGILLRVLGIVAVVLAAVALVLWTVGVLNPWDLVVLNRYFHQPGLGLFIVAVLSILAARLLAPVRNEANQQWRARVQITAVIVGVLGLLVWGLGGQWFALGQTTVLARATEGDRAVVLVERSLDDRELRVWAGEGFGERDLGRLGRACGDGIIARFLDRSEVEIETVYGTFRLRLDPATGAPVETIGDSCSGGN